MQNTALLIVDVQQALLDRRPYRGQLLITQIRSLLRAARENGVKPVYLQHDGGPGDDFERGVPGWEICAEIQPLAGERVMEKCFNSGFRDTGLDAYLRGRGVQTIILAGLQTEYCIDATCKSAAEKGYTVLIPRAGTSTFDNGPFAAGDLIRFYENNIWNGRYARVLPLEEIIAAINGACAQKI